MRSTSSGNIRIEMYFSAFLSDLGVSALASSPVILDGDDSQTILSRSSLKEFVIRSENDDGNSFQIVIDAQENLKLRGQIYAVPE